MLRVLPCLAIVLGVLSAARGADPDSARPNVIFFLADDLGFGDIGSYGQQHIKTPNIDRLAAEGMRLTVHYAGNAVCATSRCVLMTGKHPGHAFIRTNQQYRKGQEGQYPIPDETVTMLELFQDQGYRTGAFGKWGLGAPDTCGEPLRQGVDRFFGYNCQAVAHNYYPTYLWDDGHKLPLKNPAFSAHQKFPEGADPNDPASYDRYSGTEYAPDLIGEQALKFVRDNKEQAVLPVLPHHGAAPRSPGAGGLSGVVRGRFPRIALSRGPRLPPQPDAPRRLRRDGLPDGP